MLMRERAKRATRAERGGGVPVSERVGEFEGRSPSMIMMKKLVVVASVLLALGSAAAAQTAANFTGKWEGTFKMQRSGGEEGDPRPVVFDLTQKGKVLTGTAGPTAQWKVENGVVNAGTATFDVQQPDGPLFKFTLTIVKGRLQGDMAGTREGVVRGHAKVDAAKAK
jgi:opacity protein-like surface antigen